MKPVAPPVEAALLALAAPIAPAPAPPELPPPAPPALAAARLRVTLSEIRLTDRGQTRFASERLITLTPEAGGYRAEVTIGPSSAAGGPIGALFLRAQQALAGRTLVIHLDPLGEVRAVDDLAAHWQAYCNAIAAIAEGGAPAPPGAAALIERLRSASEAQQRRTLGALASGIVAGARGALPPGERPVSLPAREGAGVLEGMETVLRDENGSLRILTQAQGPLALGDARGRVVLEREERIAAGRLVTQRETRRFWPHGGEAPPALTITSELSVAPAV